MKKKPEKPDKIVRNIKKPDTFFPYGHKTGMWCRAGMNNKSLMFQKSTNDLLGWVVEKIGGIPGTVAPSFGSKKEQVTARHQYIIPDAVGNILSSCC